MQQSTRKLPRYTRHNNPPKEIGESSWRELTNNCLLLIYPLTEQKSWVGLIDF